MMKGNKAMKTTSHVKATISPWVSGPTKLKVVSIIFGMLALVLPFTGTGQITEKATPATTGQMPETATARQTPVNAKLVGKRPLSSEYRAKLEKRALNAVKQIKGEKAMIKARPEPERLFVEKTQKLFEQAMSASQWNQEQQATFEREANSLIKELQSQNLTTGCYTNCAARANRCYRGCQGRPPREAGDCNFNCLIDNILCNGGCWRGPLGTLFQKL